MFQTSPDIPYTALLVIVDNVEIPVADNFCYLGSRRQRTASLDVQLTAVASCAFGRLRKRSWDDQACRPNVRK